MNNIQRYIKQVNNVNQIFGPQHPKITIADYDYLRDRIEMDLSPENLTCDGERSMVDVVRFRNFYESALRELNRYHRR